MIVVAFNNNKAQHTTTNIRHLADSTKYEDISNK